MRRKLRQRAKDFVRPGVDLLGYSNAYWDLRSQSIELTNVLMDYQSQPTTLGDHQLLTALRAVRPVRVDFDRLARVGGAADGGYVMMTEIPADVAVSIGIGDDVTWDLAVAAQGTRVHMFDHTVVGPPAEVPRAAFSPLGVGARDQGSLRALPTIMEMSGVTAGRSAYLKIDVEGAEWSSLTVCTDGQLGAFDQIVMELHDLDRLRAADSGAEVLSALRLLGQNHVPVHLHANNCAPVVRFGSYLFPAVVEVSWVHRRHLAVVEPAERLATHLDRPCEARLADLDLSGVTRLRL